jgi:RNA polymerase sigma-70 factor (ECF subfamily)
MSLPSTATTARLVLSARDPTASLGERHAAFTQLVQQSQHVVFALALSSLRDVEDAKDVSQNAFGTAWHRLRQLRDPAAFEAWLKSIVVRECARRRRRRAVAPEAVARDVVAESEVQSADYQALIAAALEDLPEHEWHVTVLFYFLGYSQPQIARLLHLKPGTVGKRLHTARLRMRRRLPQWVRSDFVRQLPSVEFAARVRRGLLDEYIGEYRFDRRPDDIVIIAREGDSLVGTTTAKVDFAATGGAESLLSCITNSAGG